MTNAIDALRPGRSERARAGQRLGTAAAAAPVAGPAAAVPVQNVKWTDEDFAAAAEGMLPMGEPVEQWAYGDLEAGFKDAALVLDETFVVQSTGHHPMETRSAMAYWQNGKLYLHASTQSVQRTVENVARWVGIEPSRGRADLRIHRRRLRQQGRRRRVDGDPGAAVAQGERAGDDAHQPRGGELHRARAHQHDRPRQDGLPARTAASPRSTSTSCRTAAPTGRWATTARPATPRR